MPQYGTWASYGGDARIWLTIGLLAVAAGATLAGIRLPLPLPVRATRPGRAGRATMIVAWVASIAAFLVCLTIYARQYIHAYDLTASTAAPKDSIAPITFSAAAVVFVIIISRSSPGFGTRLASGAIGAMVAPMIFELPFDLIVMARTYPPIPPDPALYRTLFFAPLFLIEITTLLLLRLSPMVRLTRATFFSFALMLGVFAVWALSGFGYPSAPLPTALNIASKILAFITALTLFELDPGIQTPDLRWLWPPGGMCSCPHHTRRSSGSTRSSLSAWSSVPATVPAPGRNCVRRRCPGACDSGLLLGQPVSGRTGQQAGPDRGPALVVPAGPEG